MSYKIFNKYFIKMFDIYVNDKFLLREFDYKKAFNYASLASITIQTDRVKIKEKRWNIKNSKIQTLAYISKNGVVYNDKEEFVYSNKPIHKNLMKYKNNILEVFRLAEYLHKTNKIEFKSEYNYEFWYELSLFKILKIEAELEQTVPIQNFITRLKASLDAIKLYTDNTNFDKIFSMKLNEVVFEADKINKEYPELDLKSLIRLE